jgi:hypothetical protein
LKDSGHRTKKEFIVSWFMKRFYNYYDNLKDEEKRNSLNGSREIFVNLLEEVKQIDWLPENF